MRCIFLNGLVKHVEEGKDGAVLRADLLAKTAIAVVLLAGKASGIGRRIAVGLPFEEWKVVGDVFGSHYPVSTPFLGVCLPFCCFTPSLRSSFRLSPTSCLTSLLSRISVTTSYAGKVFCTSERLPDQTAVTPDGNFTQYDPRRFLIRQLSYA
ncbi:hypothetical protein HPP92_013920 [Vanilla planifolia]|uniref:Uncharacterized protein n=1 Tax=Vanilla planifolia TaxID=51239 RepID=A0A835QQX9_VANPL|nr:hypothetical protein HPP92_013920 [Vanilla planifolia]